MKSLSYELLANYLQVGLGEFFRITDKDGGVDTNLAYVITEDGLKMQKGNNPAEPAELEVLFNGYSQVVRIPSRPKEGQLYYYIDGTYRNSYNDLQIRDDRFNSMNMVHLMRLYSGNVFLSSKVAKQSVESLCKKLYEYREKVFQMTY